MGYIQTKADPYVHIHPAVKSNGFKYYEYVLCYFYDILFIIDRPDITMKGIQNEFKLKDDNVEETDVYLGAGLSKMTNESNLEYWEISSDNYYASAVNNVEEFLRKKGLEFRIYVLYR